jgi:hypothetical protein
MGHFYTGVKDIYFFFYYVLNKDGKDERKWTDLGTLAGDLSVRLIYSKYITDPRFKY